MDVTQPESGRTLDMADLRRQAPARGQRDILWTLVASCWAAELDRRLFADCWTYPMHVREHRLQRVAGVSFDSGNPKAG